MIKITYGELNRRIQRIETYVTLGLNPWALNEGLATKTDTCELTKDEALIFMSEEEYESRKFSDDPPKNETALCKAIVLETQSGREMAIPFEQFRVFTKKESGKIEVWAEVQSNGILREIRLG